jgi:hypothetical protein
MKPDPVDVDTAGDHYGGGGGNAPVPQGPPAPPPNCPPRFCSAHDSSEKRVKGDPVSRDCQNCGITLTSSYEGFKLCPPCSEKQQKCMICGCHAPKHTCGEPAPPPPQGPPNCPPRFCGGHDTSDKRVNSELRPGSHAPNSSSYMPGENGGNGRQGSFVPPPPPPACQDPWDRQQPSTSRSMQLNDSMFLPASANNESMFLPANRSQYENPQQAFETRLPPQGAMGQFPPGPPPRGPGQHWGGRMPPNSHNRGRQEDDESFTGFLRFVASDIWKTCHADNRRLDSPEKPFVRHGGA